MKEYERLRYMESLTATRRFWNAHRTSAYFAVPSLISLFRLLQLLIRQGPSDPLRVALSALEWAGVSFALVWAVDLCVNYVWLAPAAIHSRQQESIAGLNAELTMERDRNSKPAISVSILDCFFEWRPEITTTRQHGGENWVPDERGQLPVRQIYDEITGEVLGIVPQFCPDPKAYLEAARRSEKPSTPSSHLNKQEDFQQTHKLYITLTVRFCNTRPCSATVDACSLYIQTKAGRLSARPVSTLPALDAFERRLRAPRGIQELEPNLLLPQNVGNSRFVRFTANVQLPVAAPDTIRGEAQTAFEKDALLELKATDSLGQEWAATWAKGKNTASV